MPKQSLNWNYEKVHLFLTLLFSLTFILLMHSCKKDKEPQVNVFVKDAITRENVGGAIAGIHRCTIYDFLCGIIPYRSNTTVADGSCRFSQEDYDVCKSITVEKTGYWRAFETKITLINLYPDGWLKLRIIKSTSYPIDSKLRLTVNYVNANKFNSLEVNAAADSTIKLRCFGGVSNKIDWTVATSSGTLLNNGTFSQNITRQDTVSNTLNY